MSFFFARIYFHALIAAQPSPSLQPVFCRFSSLRFFEIAVIDSFSSAALRFLHGFARLYMYIAFFFRSEEGLRRKK